MHRRDFTKGLMALPLLVKGKAWPFSIHNTLNSTIMSSFDSELGFKLIKPKALKPGDTLGVIAPSSAIPEHKIQEALGNLEAMGFKVKLGAHLRAQNGYLAGTDAQRLADLHWAFNDPSVDGVWCIRGGYGAGRLLPQIDYNLIKNNPKVFIGYSDITALHVAIYQNTGLVTFHGPVGTSAKAGYTQKEVLNILTKTPPQYEILPAIENLQNSHNLYQTSVIHQGVAEGRLIGGNLSLLAALAGTSFALKSLKNRILFIEDIDERPYRVDRMLTQLRQSSNIHECAGIALGVFNGCNPNEGENSLSLIDSIKNCLGDLNMPIIYGLSFGHIDHQFTLPYGIKARLDTQKQSITLLESCVS